MRAQAALMVMGDEPRFRPQLAPETIDVIGGLDHEVAQVEELDELVRALVDRGVWGRLGRLIWARDTADGLLLHWEPRA